MIIWQCALFVSNQNRFRSLFTNGLHKQSSCPCWRERVCLSIQGKKMLTFQLLTLSEGELWWRVLLQMLLLFWCYWFSTFFHKNWNTACCWDLFCCSSILHLCDKKTKTNETKSQNCSLLMNMYEHLILIG